jgi:hypothetical protein
VTGGTQVRSPAARDRGASPLASVFCAALLAARLPMTIAASRNQPLSGSWSVNFSAVAPVSGQRGDGTSPSGGKRAFRGRAGNSRNRPETGHSALTRCRLISARGGPRSIARSVKLPRRSRAFPASERSLRARALARRGRRRGGRSIGRAWRARGPRAARNCAYSAASRRR